MSDTDRVLPHSLEAERALLGGVLIDNDLFSEAASVVTSDMFFRDAHQRIFKAMTELASAGKPLDLLLLREHLIVSGELEEVGGPAEIAGLVDGVPRATNVKYYAAVVREKKQLRNVILACTKTIDSAYGEMPSPEVVSAASNALMECVGTTSAGLVSAAQAMGDYVAGIDTAAAPVPTGYTDLDRLLRGGLRPGNLVIVAARPSVGKTSFALCMARNMARAGRRVLFFSLEMALEEVASRLLALESGVPAERLDTRTATADDYAATMRALEQCGLSIVFECTAGTVVEIGAWARRAAVDGLDAVVVDYLQLVEQPDARDETAAVAAVSRGFKRLAKELKVPLIALSQLSRAPEASKDKRPQLQHLRQSGALEQDADVAVLLFREEMHAAKEENRGIAEAILAKQRNGPTGVTRLAFTSELARFADLAAGF